MRYSTQLYLKRSLVFKKNGGLKVVFQDASVTGTKDVNMVYFQMAAQVLSGYAASNPNFCPIYQIGYRVWFTDS